MPNVTQTMGIVTAYGAAVKGGYTGTYEEFCAEQAHFAENAQAVVQAKTDTEEYKRQAGVSAQNAATSETNASSSANSASQSANTAQQAKVDAIAAKDQTVSAKDDAIAAKGAAETAQGKAEDAQAEAEQSAEQLSSAVEQVETNKQDITQIKADLLQKANTDGSYSDLTAGNAEQLVSTVYEEDSVPYLFRTAGGSMDIGDREEDMLVGGSVAWNQLADVSRIGTVNSPTWTQDGNVSTFTAQQKTSGVYFPYSVTTAHIYLDSVDIKTSTSTTGVRTDDWGTNSHYVQPSTNWQNISYIKRANNTGNDRLRIIDNRDSDWDAVQVKNAQIHDLTQMFGSTIADYIYSLETATPGAGVAWFRKYYPADYYPYDAGTLKSVEGVSSHDMVGFNAYNSATGTAKLVGGQQYQITGAYSALDLDGEVVTPDASGYFTPTKSGTLTVTGGNSTTTCVHLVWDGERDGEYEPYVKHSYPLDSSLTLRGIPKLDSANNLYYDGDTYESDGTVTRRYGVVDLGTLSWAHNGENKVYVSIASKKIGSQNIIADNFTRVPATTDTGAMTNGQIKAYADSQSITLFLTGINAGNASTMLSGKYLVYELATPTTETAEPYQNPQIVDDFGTEEYVTTSIVPVGHVTKYQPNLRAKLEMSPDSPDGDGDYIVRQANGENSYVSLASTTTIQDILARLTALEGNT